MTWRQMVGQGACLRLRGLEGLGVIVAQRSGAHVRHPDAALAAAEGEHAAVRRVKLRRRDDLRSRSHPLSAVAPHLPAYFVKIFYPMIFKDLLDD